MFTGINVVHTKFGKGTIVEFELVAENEFKSKLHITFESGETKKFTLEAFLKFLTTEDEKLKAFVADLETKRKEAELASQKVKEEIPEYTPYGKYSITDWEKAYKTAEEHRFKYESRAVIMDDDIIFISAADALKYIDADTRKGDMIYAACELSKKHKVYLAHEWRYATKAEIRKLIERLGDDTE